MSEQSKPASGEDLAVESEAPVVAVPAPQRFFEANPFDEPFSDKQLAFLERFEAWRAQKLDEPAGHYHRRDQVSAPPLGYVIVDVETTGLDPNTGDRIIQLCIQQADPQGTPQGEPRSWLLDPVTRYPSKEAFAVHGVSSDMLIGQPHFEDLVEVISELLMDRVFVAHRAEFDLKFIQKEMLLAGYIYQPLQKACTVEALRLVEPEWPEHTLKHWADANELAFKEHDAAEDVRMTQKLLQQLIDHYQIAPETVRMDEDNWMRQRSETDPEPPTDAQKRRALALARKLGWVNETGKVDMQRLARMAWLLNGKALKGVTRRELDRLMDALEIRIHLTEQKRVDNLAKVLKGPAAQTPDSRS